MKKKIPTVNNPCKLIVDTQNIASNYEMDKKYKERICRIFDMLIFVLFYVWICNNQIKQTSYNEGVKQQMIVAQKFHTRRSIRI